MACGAFKKYLVGIMLCTQMNYQSMCLQFIVFSTFAASLALCAHGIKGARWISFIEINDSDEKKTPQGFGAAFLFAFLAPCSNLQYVTEQ